MHPDPSSYDFLDEYCMEVLKLPKIEASMGLSRILVCVLVTIPMLGCPQIPLVPSPMPADHEYRYCYCDSRDMVLTAVMHGIE